MLYTLLFVCSFLIDYSEYLIIPNYMNHFYTHNYYLFQSPTRISVYQYFILLTGIKMMLHMLSQSRMSTQESYILFLYSPFVIYTHPTFYELCSNRLYFHCLFTHPHPPFPLNILFYILVSIRFNIVLNTKYLSNYSSILPYLNSIRI